MEPGAVSGAAASVMMATMGKEKPSNVDTAVAANALSAQKAEGAQMVDMIQKAGVSVNVTA